MKLYVRPLDLELHFRNTLSNTKCAMYEMYIFMSGTNYLFMTFRVAAV